MSRIKAFLIHLGISTAIFLVLLFFIVFIWYPSPYFSADGGWQGIRIVAGVDMILGPLLTLLVFKAGKRGLKLDLAAIGLLQAVALAWGVWTVHDQRTALVVFADGGFYTLTSEQMQRAGEQAMTLANAAKPALGYAFVHLPKDKKLLSKEKMKFLSSGTPLFLRADLYEPVDKNLSAVLERGIDVEKLVLDRKQDTERLGEFLRAKNAKPADYAFLPLQCRYQDILLVFERKSGKIVDSLAIDPAPMFNFF